MRIKVNKNYALLGESYLFSEIGKRERAYRAANPDERVIKLGIGDVTLPLAPCVIDAMHRATEEMAHIETFRGYAPEYGYDFTREAVARHYADFGVTLDPDTVFISDGAKSEVGNITDIFGDNRILIPDPVYPVYVDSNLMAGRTPELLPGNEENGFLPMPDGVSGEGYVIYLCSPNNPTGAVYSREKLREWVDFANRTGSVIIFDSAYEAFICGDYPHSIYEIDGARECAIEICSLSKTAGFTGTRCGWTIVPEELKANGVSLRTMWMRRQATKFNGVPYVIQRAAEAALSPEGIAECMENIAYYRANAKTIADVLVSKNIKFTGGVSSPYIWMKCPNGMGSWEFFDYLLTKTQIVGTPGEGFGRSGEGYFRLTAFGNAEATREAAERLIALL